VFNKKQKQDIGALLGGVSLGVGLGFLAAPGLAGRMLGMKPEATPQEGSRFAVRALGIRDVAFGIGLLATREERKAGAIWRRLFGLCMAGDAGAALLALRKPGANFFTFAGGLSSALLAVLAFNSTQED
jgi:hypothetical protein